MAPNVVVFYYHGIQRQERLPLRRVKEKEEEEEDQIPMRGCKKSYDEETESVHRISLSLVHGDPLGV